MCMFWAALLQLRDLELIVVVEPSESDVSLDSLPDRVEIEPLFDQTHKISEPSPTIMQFLDNLGIKQLV